MFKHLVFALVLIWTGQSVKAEEATTWSQADAAELLAFVEQLATDGLDPADYDLEALRKELANDNGQLDARATRTFIHLASDLSQGHVRNRAAVSWFITGPSQTDEQALGILETALAHHKVGETLHDLAPRHPQYLALKKALALARPSDRSGIRRIRANLERWRWMPRDLGARYLLVNVPAYAVTRFESGSAVDTRRVIVGKPSTPTPQFSALVSGVIFNPWWDVPDSIVKESVGKLVRTQPGVARQRGYVVQGGRIRQRPGPGNSLGQIKLVMPNGYRVYLHDTPSRGLFEQSARALSHGCIRTQEIVGLAQELLDGTPGWTRTEIDRALASGATVQADLARPLPVYVTYFTAVAREDGTLAAFPDIYRRDDKIVSQLVDRELN